MSKFLHNAAAANDDNKDDAKAIVIPMVFSEHSQAKSYPITRRQMGIGRAKIGI